MFVSYQDILVVIHCVMNSCRKLVLIAAEISSVKWLPKFCKYSYYFFYPTELSISGILLEVGPTEEKVTYFANVIMETPAGPRLNFSKYGTLPL